MLRGQNSRGIEFADIWTVELENEGYSTNHPFIISLKNGKKNQHGRLEFGGIMRAKDVEVCGVGALALYLFDRLVSSVSEGSPR